MDIELKPKKVAQFLLALAFCFILAHLAGQLAEINLGSTFGLSVFNPEEERSIPRFYSSVLLLLCSVLLLIIAMRNKEESPRNFLYWLGLAPFFLFLAITENTALHESLATPIRSALNVSKIQFYAWIYGILVIILPALYLKFFLGLPRKTMILFIIGGSTFIAGAFALDLVVAYLGKSSGHHTAAYIGLATLEAVFEMVGIIIFVYALLCYMHAELKWIRVRISG
jgi:hypothetical protein